MFDEIRSLIATRSGCMTLWIYMQVVP